MLYTKNLDFGSFFFKKKPVEQEMEWWGLKLTRSLLPQIVNHMEKSLTQ